MEFEQKSLIHSESSALVSVEQQRAIQEVQASMIIAKRFPRDQDAAFTRIMKACERVKLAENAEYVYPRGGQQITGPSIRLAEVIAQNWQNLDFGIRELSQRDGESEVQSYCWDMETNVRQSKTFTVKHSRKAKGSYKALDDPRDIYEHTANQGARRLRACILGIVPGDIIDAAIEQCRKTLQDKNKDVPIQDRIRQMLMGFDKYGVTKEMIEERIGHKTDSIIEQELVNLRKIYVSLKDEMSKREDWFGSGDGRRADDLNAEIKREAETGAKKPPPDDTNNQKPHAPCKVHELKKQADGNYQCVECGLIIPRDKAEVVREKTESVKYPDTLPADWFKFRESFINLRKGGFKNFLTMQRNIEKIRQAPDELHAEAIDKIRRFEIEMPESLQQTESNTGDNKGQDENVQPGASNDEVESGTKPPSTTDEGFRAYIPGSPGWSQYWTDHPECHDQMLDYRKTPEAQERMKAAGYTNAFVQEQENAGDGIPGADETTLNVADLPECFQSIRAELLGTEDGKALIKCYDIHPEITTGVLKLNKPDSIAEIRILISKIDRLVDLETPETTTTDGDGGDSIPGGDQNYQRGPDPAMGAM